MGGNGGVTGTQCVRLPGASLVLAIGHPSHALENARLHSFSCSPTQTLEYPHLEYRSIWQSAPGSWDRLFLQRRSVPGMALRSFRRKARNQASPSAMLRSVRTPTDLFRSLKTSCSRPQNPGMLEGLRAYPRRGLSPRTKTSGGKRADLLPKRMWLGPGLFS